MARQFRIEFDAITANAERGFQRVASESQNLTGKLERTKVASLEVRDATLRVEAAQQRAARATSTYGRDSLKAAQANVALERSQTRLRGEIDKTSGRTKLLGTHLRSAAGAALGFGAALVSIHAAKDAVETTESLAKSTITLHRNFGLSTAAASTWSAVLKVNNIDQKAAQMSFTTLAKQVAAGTTQWDVYDQKLAALGNSQQDQVKRQALIAAGAGKSAAALQTLGISQDDLRKQNFESVLSETAKGLTDMAGGTQRAALAQQLLGRGAKVLAPLFRGDGLGFQQQAKWAREYGVTLDGHALKSSKDLAVATTQLRFAQMGMQILFTEKVIPTLVDAANTVARFIKGMRDGTGAGGKFADQMLSVWQQLQPVRSALKAIGGFLAQHPRLLLAAAGAFVIWKTAAAAASVFAKGKLIATFLGLGPKAAAGGAAAGSSFGTAATASMGSKLRAFGWGGIGRLAGTAFGLAFAPAAVTYISGLVGKALHFNPSAATGGGGGIKIGSGGSGIAGSGIGPTIHLPSWLGGATGGVIAGPRGAGDIVPLWTKPGEVVLTEEMQNALGRNRVMSTVSAMGGRSLGHLAGASTGGVVGDFNRALSVTHASPKASLALFEAGIVESGLRNLPYGDADSRGALQIRDSTARGMHVNNMDPYASAIAFLTRGFWGHGGALSLSRGSGSAGQVAQLVQGSAFPSRYDAVRGQALAYVGGKSGGGGGSSVRPSHSEVASGTGSGSSSLLRKSKASKLPTYTDRSRPLSDFDNFYNAALTNAQVSTPGDTTDDRRVLDAYQKYAAGEWSAAVASGDSQRIIDAGSRLDTIKGDYAAIDPSATGAGTSGAVDNSSLLQGIHDQLAEQNARAHAITGSQDGVLAHWVAEMLMGRVGTTVGLGAQMPSSPGVVARLN